MQSDMPFLKKCAAKNALMLLMSSIGTARKKLTRKINAQGSPVLSFHSHQESVT